MAENTRPHPQIFLKSEGRLHRLAHGHWINLLTLVRKLLTDLGKENILAFDYEGIHEIKW